RALRWKMNQAEVNGLAASYAGTGMMDRWQLCARDIKLISLGLPVMKLTQLRHATAITERGSLRAAARHLGVAQPAFSRSIAELERELGAPLFERRAKGMVATSLGKAFVQRAAAILNDVRRAQDEFEQLRGNAVGSVSIGLSIAA